MASNPGCVITSEKLSSLLASSWPQSVTVLNIMAGFKKTGIHPLNPSEISDRQIAPSTVFQDPTPPPPPTTTDVDSSLNGDAAQPLFSPEKELLFQRRYEENYNVGDPEYIAWLRINHPEFNVSGSFSETSSSHSSSTGQALSDILVLPKAPLKQKKKQKEGINSHVVCLTDDEVLDEMKNKETEREKKEQERIEKQKLKEQKKREREDRKREKEKKRERRGEETEGA